MRVKANVKACDVRAAASRSGEGRVTVTIDGSRDDLTALLRSLLRALGLKSPTGITLTAKRGHSLRLPGPRPRRRPSPAHDDHGGGWRRVGHSGEVWAIR